MTIRSYQTPHAFKNALDDRLYKAANNVGVEFERRRQLLVFDRFLARIAKVFGDAATLKGGLVLELRLQRARATKDVDLRVIGHVPATTPDKLQEAGRLDLGDFMHFEVTVDDDHPEIQGDGVKYDGKRFWTKCTIAGRPYGRPFGVDVAFGDPILGDPDVVVADDVLGFAGVEPPTLRLYPVVTHIAEKLHAYTLPRARPNTRVKDLPDVTLLAGIEVEAARLLAALQQTFTYRGTHPLPRSLPPPPASWKDPYATMAAEHQLPWATIEDVTLAAQQFLDPILDDRTLIGTWNPTTWRW